jgi:pyrroline-5-carboxylate reductase
MPNLAIAYQKSVTALCVNKDSSQVPFVKHDLEKLGKVIELPEQHFDLFTGIF